MIEIHHFAMLLGGLEEKDAAHYKVSLWYLILNTYSGKMCLILNHM